LFFDGLRTVAIILLVRMQLARRSAAREEGSMYLNVTQCPFETDSSGLTPKTPDGRPSCQRRSLRIVVFTLTWTLSGAWAAGDHAKTRPRDQTADGAAVLWSEPTDLAERDLFYGPGGKKHEPHGPFTFVKEDLNGTNPKFVVHDVDSVKWKVKLGLEARSETAASRIVWAAGYYVNEDYFVPAMQIAGMPEHLHRGQKLIGPGGVVHNARLKRGSEDEKKLGIWQWTQDEFTGSRQWNGVRVLMALINNWDLKDENNAIYRTGCERIYMVSDLGAAFAARTRQGQLGVLQPVQIHPPDHTGYGRLPGARPPHVRLPGESQGVSQPPSPGAPREKCPSRPRQMARTTSGSPVPGPDP